MLIYDQELSQAPLTAEQATDWLRKKMNKDINKFKNSKGKITNKLASDIYETQMDKDMTTKEKKEKYDMLGIGASLVHIYFKDLGIIRYTREESYSVVDLIGKH